MSLIGHKLAAWTLLAGAACASDDADPASPVPEEEEEAVEMLSPAIFIQPSTGQLSIRSTQLDDLRLGITGVRADTSLLIDGRSQGRLNQATRTGFMDPAVLTLNMGGALTVGRHVLELFHPGTAGPLFSTPLNLDVEIVDPPQLEVELEDRGEAYRIFAVGSGADSLLLVADDAPATGLRLYRGRFGAESQEQPQEQPRELATQWDHGHPLALQLPFALPFDEVAPALSAAHLQGGDANSPTEPSDDETETATSLIAWRNEDGSQLWGTKADWATLSTTAPVVLADAEDLELESTHWRRFGRPWVTPSTTTIELDAPLDIEESRPGDLRLVQVAWDGDEPGRPRPMRELFGHDTELLGPYLRPTDERFPESSTTLVRREGWRIETITVEHPNGRTRLTDAPPERPPRESGAPGVTAAVEGALGSRLWVRIKGNGDLSAWRADMYRGEFEPLRLPDEELPQTSARPSLTVGIALGHPLFLLSYGEDAPLHALISDGEQLSAVRFESTFCDEAALLASEQGNRSGELGLACRHGDKLRLGVLRAVRP